MGDWVECPVSGVPLLVAESSTRVEFEGASYVVCCAGCADALRKQPKAFLEPVCRADPK